MKDRFWLVLGLSASVLGGGCGILFPSTNQAPTPSTEYQPQPEVYPVPVEPSQPEVQIPPTEASEQEPAIYSEPEIYPPDPVIVSPPEEAYSPSYQDPCADGSCDNPQGSVDWSEADPFNPDSGVRETMRDLDPTGW